MKKIKNWLVLAWIVFCMAIGSLIGLFLLDYFQHDGEVKSKTGNFVQTMDYFNVIDLEVPLGTWRFEFSSTDKFSIQTIDGKIESYEVERYGVVQNDFDHIYVVEVQVGGQYVITDVATTQKVYFAGYTNEEDVLVKYVFTRSQDANMGDQHIALVIIFGSVIGFMVAIVLCAMVESIKEA